MSPERARIFIAEDNQVVRKNIVMALMANGHSIEIEATSLREAIAKVEEAKERRIDVALIDGSLSGDSNDGPMVAQILKKEIPEIKIISISGDEETDWADEHCQKPFTFEELLEKVREI